MRYQIANWSSYQHYKHRNPPWIRLYQALLTSPCWVSSNDASRVLMVACMLLACRNEAGGGTFDGDPVYVKRVCYLNSKPNFKPLVDCGFLIPLADCKHDASTMRAGCYSESDSSETDNSEVQKQSARDRARVMAQEVLAYLNKKTGRTLSNYENIMKCIVREKATVADCKKVIDFKWGEWKGTDQAKFMNAVTPWRPKHFKDYLDEANSAPPSDPSKVPAESWEEREYRKMMEEDSGP